MQQASRAVNQAIGRIIRHKMDYGAIILCDERFQGKKVQLQLSSWIQPEIKNYTDYGEFMKNLIAFFRKLSANPPTFDPKMLSETSIHSKWILPDSQPSQVENLDLNKEPEDSQVENQVENVQVEDLQVEKEVEKKEEQNRDPKDAKEYLQLVKSILKKEDYSTFRQLLQKYKAASISLQDLIESIYDLMSSEQDLLQGFVQFVPAKKRDHFRAFLRDRMGSSTSTSHAKDDPIILEDSESQHDDAFKVPNPPHRKSPASICIDPPKSISSDATKISPIPKSISTPKTSPISPISPSGWTKKQNKGYDLVHGQNSIRIPKRPKTSPASKTSPEIKPALEESRSDEDCMSDEEVSKPNAITKESPSKSGGKCPVCQEEYKNPHSARCGHVCCFECWEHALELKLECPICRERTRLGKLRKLFLDN
eukprot:TRINITY_DN3150_c0_g1_i4.p1 TRINITY_DN3150_c0_g1~~TRINITY_DN3150_c0_g1_i4.p1  ORF type:complete len:424 (+),score=168.33 TRINITY_DN3150_c0_g1_i4:78-1349(+)